MDRGAWWPTVHRVAKSRTQLSDFTFTFIVSVKEQKRTHRQRTPLWLHGGRERERGGGRDGEGTEREVVIAAAAAKSLPSCVTLCNPIEGSPPGSPAPGILRARTLQWVALSFSNACMHAKSLQSCPTLGNSKDSSPPSSSVHRIL